MADQTSSPAWLEPVLWRKSGGDQGNHTRREDEESAQIGQSAWLNTSESPYMAKGTRVNGWLSGKGCGLFDRKNPDASRNCDEAVTV